MARAVGVDFGTTNSAIAAADGPAAPRLATFADGDGRQPIFRSILYFDGDGAGEGGPAVFAGPLAIERYLSGDGDGRLVQSLKSFLASRSFSATSVMGSSLRLEEIVSLFLTELRRAAERELGPLGGSAVVGRPVRFAGAANATDDQRALDRLRTAFRLAGFDEVFFEYEPVAAAYFYERQLDRDELILIADFGGGTSDFSLLRVGPGPRASGCREEQILGSDGIGIAGDAFDGCIVRNAVAPHLGLGAEYRSIFGRLLRVPAWIYADLQRWHHLSFLRSPKTMGILFDLRRESTAAEKFDALIHLVQRGLGFQLYRSVERVKLELSETPSGRLFFENGPVAISEEIVREDFEQWVSESLEAVSSCVDGLFGRTGVNPDEVGRVFMTGGSSFVPAVRAIFAERFPGRLRTGGELTSVAAGLALRARELER